MAENRFGILYTLTRIALVVFVIIVIVLNIVGLTRTHDRSTEYIIWVVFCFIALAIGLIGAWKEHFLFSLIFSITNIILVCFAGWLWAGSTAGIVIMILLSIGYTLMLYFDGRREMGVPQMC